MKVNNWHNCYDDGWNNLIVPEAFSHPAKFSYKLTERMFGHAISQGWIGTHGIVVDPFGGVGCGGIVAAYSDLTWVGVELEQTFVDLAKQNFKRHRRKWEKLGSPQPQIIQGDSRKLCEVLEQADIVVSSPPFMDARQDTTRPKPPASMDGNMADKDGRLHRLGACNYGQTPGQLGAMKPGQVDAVISSPPYAETLKGDGTQSETAAESRAKRQTEGGSLGQSQRTQGYGSKGNLGNLKPGDVDCVVSSPPFEGTHVADGEAAKLAAQGNARKIPDGATSGGVRYGNEKGNLGQEQGPTFWQAAKEIVQQCHQILKPGGHAIWVVKAFVRKGEIVDFPGDWQKLCESVGFKTLHKHRAMLVKETVHNGLFGDIKEKTERKSFFRRLAESKGSPRIDYEVVLCMEK